MFRLTDDAEIQPHTPRDDEEQFPVMLYVTYTCKTRMDSIHSYRFIFSRHSVSTARSIIGLTTWLARSMGVTQENLIIHSILPVEEEVTR
ncbi:MAG TPA: hypothetical protein VFT59_00620 [Candidatus Saccharimonadales bacterium]|nr:hypothetical protein [Candidatus Saccharimonadales bacterium]